MKNLAPLKILKASAGSGKTFSLTLHYLGLILNNENNYREILAVTFTNKATAEMKDRILSVLLGLAKNDKSDKINSYRTLLLEGTPNWTEDFLQNQADLIYRKILHDYSNFSISTIDSFSQKIIRSMSFELGLDALYQVELKTSKVKEDLVLMLNQLLNEKPELLNWILTLAENRINESKSWNYKGTLIKLAELLFKEDFQIFESHIAHQDSSELFTNLNKALNDRLNKYNSTIQALAAYFCEVYKTANINEQTIKGKSRNALVVTFKKFTELSKDPSIGIDLDKIITQLEKDDTYKIGAGKDQYHDIALQQDFEPILSEIKKIRAVYYPEFLGDQAVEKNIYFLRLLIEMSRLLGVWRKENRAQLISDTQLLLGKLGLDKNNDPTFIWEKTGNRYNYFLFDEFQDTSVLQWRNLSPLLINALAKSDRSIQEHLIVGDIKQSIYRWRNGDWRILLEGVENEVNDAFNLKRDQENPFISNESLTTNYRSEANIVKFNNAIYKALPEKLQEVLNQQVYQNMNQDQIDWWEANNYQNMLTRAYANSEQQVSLSKAKNPSGVIEIEFFPVENDRSRHTQVKDHAVDRVCEKIISWVKNGTYRPDQIGILIRTNKEAPEIINKLSQLKDQNNLDFNILSADSLLISSNLAISLIIDTYKALLHSSKEYAVYKANAVYKYMEIKGNEISSEQWLSLSRLPVEELHDLLPQPIRKNWRHLQSLPLLQLTDKLIEYYSLANESTEHIPYLLAFKDLIIKFNSNGEKGLGDFLEYWEIDGKTIALDLNSTSNAIEVTTIHKSKGLDYDVVLIPHGSWDLGGKVNQIFWANSEGTNYQGLGKIPLNLVKELGQSSFYKAYYQELVFNYMDALNTLYVATTRAVKHLYIAGPQFQIIKGEPKIKSDVISDILLQIFLNDPKNFDLETYSYIEGELPKESPQLELTDQFQDSRLISLDTYSTSKKLEIIFASEEKRELSHILSLQKAARYGELAHDILAKTKNSKESKRFIQKYIDQGLIEQEEEQSISEEIDNVWSNPQIIEWMANAKTIKNEQSIVLADGKTIRPDKVFMLEDLIIVLDFKFTTKDEKQHLKQVSSYIKALELLGYSRVEGYIFYTKTNQIKKV